MLPIMKMPAKYCSKMVLLKWPAAINSTANLHRGRLIQLPQQAQQDSLCGPPLVRSPFENPNRLPAGAAAAAIAAQLSQQQQQQQQSTSQQQPTAQSNAEETPSAAPSAAASASTTETQEASPQESTAAAPAQTSETPREEKDGAEQQLQQQKEEAGGADEPPTEQQNQEEAAKVSGFVQRQFKAAYIGLFVIGGIVITGVVYVFCIADPPRDPVTGQELRDKFSDDWWPRFSRFLDFLRFSKDLLVEPSRDKLLPDPVKPPWHQPKYTVVLEIRNVLVSPQWNYKNGHYFVKRPALDYFMEVVGYPNFELVIYTSENMSNGHLIQQIDPKGHRVNHALFRDCTKYMASKKSWLGGVHVKDLSRLNRDLKRVIYIDWEPEAFQLNPDNVLRVPKWQGDMNDTFLVDLAELLKTIHLSDVDDVRPVLQFYSQFDNPMAEFRRRAKMLVQEEPTQTQQQQQSSATAATPSSSTPEDPLKKYRGNLFGARRHAV